MSMSIISFMVRVAGLEPSWQRMGSGAPDIDLHRSSSNGHAERTRNQVKSGESAAVMESCGIACHRSAFDGKSGMDSQKRAGHPPPANTLGTTGRWATCSGSSTAGTVSILMPCVKNRPSGPARIAGTFLRNKSYPKSVGRCYVSGNTKLKFAPQN